MPLSKIARYSIRTLDLAATRKFYTEVMGLIVGPRRKFNFPGVISAVILISFAGVAVAGLPPPPPPPPPVSPTIADSQPNNNPGLATNLLSVSGLGLAGNISDAAGNFALGGGGQSAGLDVKRYALSGSTGAAAAPGAKLWNVWGAFSRSNIGYDYAPLQSSGSVNVYLAGVDYTFANNVVFGVAAAVDRTDVDLNFSAGKLNGRGVTVSPYVGVAINNKFALDATLGYGQTNVDTVAGGVTGSTRSDRNMGSLGLTYREVIGAWTLTSRSALLKVRDKLGAYTLSNGTFVPDGTVNVTQIRLIAQAAYTSGPFTPYISLSYINDIQRLDQAPVGGIAAANDRDAWTPAIGVRFKADNSLYGSIQYSTERGRSEVKNNQLLVTVGIRF